MRRHSVLLLLWPLLCSAQFMTSRATGAAELGTLPGCCGSQDTYLVSLHSCGCAATACPELPLWACAGTSAVSHWVLSCRLCKAIWAAAKRRHLCECTYLLRYRATPPTVTAIVILSSSGVERTTTCARVDMHWPPGGGARIQGYWHQDTQRLHAAASESSPFACWPSPPGGGPC